MDTYEKELLLEIAKLVQKKYTHINEVFRITREIADGLSRDDKVTVQLLLGMRGEELEAMAECDKSGDMLLAGTQELLQESVDMLLKGECSKQWQDQDMAHRVMGIVQNTKTVVGQTIQVDKQTSCRLAGEDSFYNER